MSEPKPRYRVRGEEVIAPLVGTDDSAAQLQSMAEDEASPESDNAYQRLNYKTRQELNFKWYSFFAFGITSLFFFAFTLYLLCKVMSALTNAAHAGAFDGFIKMMPYFAGFILLTATLGLSICIAILKYAFVSGQKSEKVLDSIPMTPLAKVIVDFFAALASQIKNRS